MKQGVAAAVRDLWRRRRVLKRQVFLSIVFGIVVAYVDAHGVAFFRFLTQRVHPLLLGLLFGTGVSVLGWTAHWFKLRNQIWYGAIEVVFGMISGFDISADFSINRPLAPQFAALIGCAYVIARGLNNVDEGRVKLLTALFDKMTGMAEKVGEFGEQLANTAPLIPPPADPEKD